MKFSAVSTHKIPSSNCELRGNRCIKSHDLLKDAGYAVAQLVEALRYKPEGRGFVSRWSTGRTVALGLTQPLTEKSTRNISGG
jgi:hypothetical protein